MANNRIVFGDGLTCNLIILYQRDRTGNQYSLSQDSSQAVYQLFTYSICLQYFPSFPMVMTLCSRDSIAGNRCEGSKGSTQIDLADQRWGVIEVNQELCVSSYTHRSVTLLSHSPHLLG